MTVVIKMMLELMTEVAMTCSDNDDDNYSGFNINRMRAAIKHKTADNDGTDDDSADVTETPANMTHLLRAGQIVTDTHKHDSLIACRPESFLINGG